ncbi:MAG: serine--tRNA ligase, partial [Oscillospiraceae bacterium]
MIDIKLLRTEPEKVIAALARRKEIVDIEGLLKLDTKKRELIYEAEGKKAEQNAVSKQIPQLKKDGKDTTSIFEEMKKLSAEIKKYDDEVREIDVKMNEILYTIPNIPNAEVPDGDTDEDNIEVRRFMEPTKFDFEPLAHWDLGKSLGILDPETAAKVTGARFHIYSGLGARLERAIINFYLDTHTSKGYREIFPPFMVHRDSMVGTGQLPKFEEDAFKVANTDYFLVPTAEVPVTNMHRDEILDGDKLPLKYCAYTACFRAEAGSAGRDTRGLIRQHQFNKVELVKFSKPENSYAELDALIADAEAVLQALKLPYRVVKIC